MILLCHQAVFLPLAFWSPSPTEMLLVGVIALLLYGGKLPEVAREWGKTFNDFRRSLNNVRDDLNDALYSEPDASHRLEYHPDFQDDAVTDDGTADDGTADDGALGDASVDSVDAADAVADDAKVRGADPTDSL